MNDKKIINKKLGELYQTFIQKNYCKVYNEFFDFNIKLGEFRENINILLRKLAEILILKYLTFKVAFCPCILAKITFFQKFWIFFLKTLAKFVCM